MTTYNYFLMHHNETSSSVFLSIALKKDNNLALAYLALKQARKHKIPASSKEDLLRAHTYTLDNYPMLFAQQACVCIYCKERFASHAIRDYSYSEKGTALCPKCGIDSIVGEYAGFELSDAFIEKMHEYFFDNND